MEEGNRVRVLVTAAEPARRFYFLAPSVDAAVGSVDGSVYKGLVGELIPDDFAEEQDLGHCMAVRVVAQEPSKRELYFFATNIEEAVNHAKCMGYGGVDGGPISVSQIPRTNTYVQMSSTRRKNKLDHALDWAKKHDPAMVKKEKPPKEKKDEPPKEIKFSPKHSYCISAFALID